MLFLLIPILLIFLLVSLSCFLVLHSFPWFCFISCVCLCLCMSFCHVPSVRRLDFSISFGFFNRIFVCLGYMYIRSCLLACTLVFCHFCRIIFYSNVISIPEEDGIFLMYFPCIGNAMRGSEFYLVVLVHFIFILVFHFFFSTFFCCRFFW